MISYSLLTTHLPFYQSGGFVSLGAPIPGWLFHLWVDAPGVKAVPLCLQNNNPSGQANTETAIRFLNRHADSDQYRSGELSMLCTATGVQVFRLRLANAADTTFPERLRVMGNTGSLLIGTTTDGLTSGGSLAVSEDLAHRGGKVGFFGAAPAAKASVADLGALATTETADSSYSSNEVSMLNNLKSDVTSLRSKLNALLDALQSYGLV